MIAGSTTEDLGEMGGKLNSSTETVSSVAVISVAVSMVATTDMETERHEAMAATVLATEHLAALVIVAVTVTATAAVTAMATAVLAASVSTDVHRVNSHRETGLPSATTAVIATAIQICLIKYRSVVFCCCAQVSGLGIPNPSHCFGLWQSTSHAQLRFAGSLRRAQSLDCPRSVQTSVATRVSLVNCLASHMSMAELQ